MYIPLWHFCRYFDRTFRITNGRTLWYTMRCYDELCYTLGTYCLTYDCVFRNYQRTYPLIHWIYKRDFGIQFGEKPPYCRLMVTLVLQIHLKERVVLVLLFATMMRSWKLRRMGLSSLVTYDWWSDGRSLLPPCECLETPMIWAVCSTLLTCASIWHMIVRTIYFVWAPRTTEQLG